jgi:hypothetical protein
LTIGKNETPLKKPLLLLVSLVPPEKNGRIVEVGVVERVLMMNKEKEWQSKYNNNNNNLLLQAIGGHEYIDPFEGHIA